MHCCLGRACLSIPCFLFEQTKVICWYRGRSQTPNTGKNIGKMLLVASTCCCCLTRLLQDSTCCQTSKPCAVHQSMLDTVLSMQIKVWAGDDCRQLSSSNIHRGSVECFAISSGSGSNKVHVTTAACTLSCTAVLLSHVKA